jgi:hypothetical protein
MQFRAYYIDGQEYVRGAIDIRVKSPDEAVEKAKVLRSSHTVEVWEIDPRQPEADRLLKRFEPPRH